MKKAQRCREKPLQRIALAGIEERRGVCVGRGGVAPVFVPAKQLDQRLRALHHVAGIVEERGLALQGRITEPVALNPFEGLELGVGAVRRASTASAGACCVV